MRRQKIRTHMPAWIISSLFSIGILFGMSNFGLAAPAAEPASEKSQVPSETPVTEIVREIADIQRQLGGSIVAGRQNLAPIQPNHHPAPSVSVAPKSTSQNNLLPHHQLTQAYATPRYPVYPAESKVKLLRSAATQLDNTASQLESADLYLQADELRKTAQDFRLEARKLRAGQAPTLVQPRTRP